MFELTRSDLSATDRKAADTLAEFYQATPAGLLDTDPEAWPEMFTSRLAFEAWRERWLAYWAGLADGPSSPQEYAALRPRLWSHPRTARVDRFHS